MGVLFAAAAVNLGLVSLWAAYSAVCLLRNYSKAVEIGLPIRVIPISHTNPFWMLVDRKVLAVLKKLPLLGRTSFARYNFRSFEMLDRYRSHHEMGDAFVVVTPGRNWLYLAEPDALMNVFKRRTDFPRCLELTEVLNVFGPNMSTVDGQQWKTQRKMTATCFNEPNNQIVWSESLYLAKDMLRYWTSKPELKTTADDTRTLSLHVLSRAGFGKSFKFEGHDERQESSPSASYKASLQTILENCVLIMVLGTKFLEKPWLPRKLRVLHEACVAFKGYMTDLYEEEKRAVAEGRSTDKNLMNSMVRASQELAVDGNGMTEQEIYGNMFVFNFAGHDTTAHTFTFSIYFLAANPDVQAWVREEIQQVLGDSDEWSYKEHFPRLKRCLAIMNESVRLYTPVPVAKWTHETAQELDVGNGKTVVLPPDTMVIPSYASVHTDPRYWGSDSLKWRPSRWIENGSNASNKPQPGQEELISPRPGTYLGWSEGARDCPGKKFSQVEFVATMATLLKEWRVDPIQQQGESPEAARRRVEHLIEDDSWPVLILQMLHPERAPLRWTKWDE